MALFVFKIIFLVVFVIGGIIMLVAPFIYPAKANGNEAVRNHKITRLRLIGVVVACVGLLLVIILSNVK